uniref:Uncharacterized protein n=1 Tax=Myoviridae sp. ctCo31 TaxID=2825053 RepID=A0A8S5UMR4_9CAUD|nr:MAG TPA: hypothetical protein [Myoviridae sp. ctCo31]
MFIGIIEIYTTEHTRKRLLKSKCHYNFFILII